MPETSDGKIGLFALIAFAGWLFVALPLLYLPGEHIHGELLGVRYGEWLLFAATMGLWWATWRLVTGTEKTAERQLRAYVSVMKGIVTNIDGPGPIEATVTVKNSGQTPAYDLVIWGGMSIRVSSDDMIVPPEKGTPHPAILAPGAEVFKVEKTYLTSNGDITDYHRTAIKEGRATLTVHGEITYIDAFGKKRFCNYRRFCGGSHPNSFFIRDGKTVGRLSPSEVGNEAN
jgi:hypothetical protein